MSHIAIDPINPSRESLWARLEEINYFNWCRKREYKQLHALFFEGEVVEHPENFIACRELFWSPKQTPEHWRAVIERRTTSIDDNGERYISQRSAEKHTKETVNSLLLCDYQFAGMSIEQQLALQNLLGLEGRDLWHDRLYFETWLAQIESWLEGDAIGEVELPGMYDCVAAHRVAFAYELLNAAPLALQEGHFVPLQDGSVWGGGKEAYLQRIISSFCEFLLKPYQPPAGLQCDPSPRIQCVERLRADLETGQAPLLLQQVWQLTKDKNN